MKKYGLSLILLIALGLSACGNQNNNQTQNTTTAEEVVGTNISITINNTVTDEVSEAKEYTIAEEDNLQTFLEKNFNAVFENGMMTELNGIKQDEDANQYWMYYVNDEMPQIGIGEYEVKDGDKVEFKFEQF